MNRASSPIIDITGMICQVDVESGILHAVCRIRYFEYDTGEFKYIFTPNYPEIDSLGEETFDGIQGLDLSRRQTTYQRKNRTPTFISERVPAENREDVRQLFLDCDMEGRSKLEWLMKTHFVYSGDRLIVRNLTSEEGHDRDLFENVQADESLIRNMISPDSDVVETSVDGEGASRRGRPSKSLDANIFKDVRDRYAHGLLSAKEAARMLEISESTFYRRLRSQEKEDHKEERTRVPKKKGRFANEEGKRLHSGLATGRLETAQAEIVKLDGADFQRLCIRYVNDAYMLGGLVCSGAQPGTYATAAGTPDAFWNYPDGSYLVLEAGHYNSNRASAKKKIIGDIERCLDYEAAHLPENAMKRIVICYSYSRFDLGDIEDIRDAFPHDGDRIELVGPDQLALAVTEYYPWIGRELLGIAFRSNAVMDECAFVSLHENSKSRASLDTKLVGRDDELEKLKDLLKDNQIVVISGESGAGKTRLALEAARQYAESVDSPPIVVKGTKDDISEELVLCCSQDKEYIIVLDDVNELSHLSFLAGFLRDRTNVKVLATVRNYALDTVRDLLRDCSMQIMSLARLEDAGLDHALRDGLGIQSRLARRTISYKTHGNLRLAFFAHKAYGDEIPEDVPFGVLMKDCYGLATAWLSENAKRAIRVSSILGAHRTFENDDLDRLLEVVGLPHGTYLEACQSLCENELMDSVQGTRAVSFEEQNLRDYFIYDSLVVSRIISLSDIWSLKDGVGLLVNAVNILIQVFGDSEVIDIVVQQLAQIWDKLSSSQKEDFVSKFNVLLGANGLEFLGEVAEASPGKFLDPLELLKAPRANRAASPDSWFVEPLVSFARRKQYFNVAIGNVLDLIGRGALTPQEVEKLLVEDVSSGRWNDPAFMDFEIRVFEAFEQRYEKTQEDVFAACLILLAKGALKDEVGWAEYDGRNVTFMTAKLHASDSIVQHRVHVLDVLRLMFDKGLFREEILDLVFGYSVHGREYSRELFSTTLSLVSERFLDVAPLDTLTGMRLVSGFIGQCTDAGLADCVSQLMNRINESDKTAFLFGLASERVKHECIEENRIVGIALELDEIEWKEVFEELSDVNMEAHLGWKIQRIMPSVFKKIEDVQKIDSLCDLMLACGVPPYGGNIVARSFQGRLGASDGRQRIIDSRNRYLRSWLSIYDSFCLREDFAVENPEAYIISLLEYGEILELEEILKIDGRHTGFASEYFASALISEAVEDHMLWKLLPSDEQSCAVIEAFSNRESVFESLVTIAFRVLRVEKWISDSVLSFLFDQRKSFLIELIASGVEVGSLDGIGNYIQRFWLECTKGELRKLKNCIEKLSDDFDYFYSLRDWLKALLREACDCGRMETALVWLDSLKGSMFSRFGICSEIVCALDATRKIQCLIFLCEMEIERETFDNTAFGFSFEGKSWWGSESSVVSQDIEFAEQLKHALEDAGLYKYVLSCDKHIEQCKRRLNEIEIEDFVNGW